MLGAQAVQALASFPWIIAARSMYRAHGMANADANLSPEERIQRDMTWADVQARYFRALDAYEAEIQRRRRAVYTGEAGQ